MVNKKPKMLGKYPFFREAGGGSPLPSSASADGVSIPYSSLEYDLRDLSGINKALTLLNRRLVRLEVDLNMLKLKFETLDPAVVAPSETQRLSEQDVALVECFIARKLRAAHANPEEFIASVRGGNYHDEK